MAIRKTVIYAVIFTIYFCYSIAHKTNEGDLEMSLDSIDIFYAVRDLIRSFMG